MDLKKKKIHVKFAAVDTEKLVGLRYAISLDNLKYA